MKTSHRFLIFTLFMIALSGCRVEGAIDFGSGSSSSSSSGTTTSSTSSSSGSSGKTCILFFCF